MKIYKKYSILFVLLVIVLFFIVPNISVLLFGVFVLLLGIDYYFAIRQIEKDGKITFGKIIAYKRSSRGYQTPVINFTADNGIIVEDEPYFSTANDFNKFVNFKKTLNTDVRVKYYLKDPEKFVIFEENSIPILPVLLVIGLGMIFITISILSLFGVINVHFQ